MMANDDRYEAVLASIGRAMSEATDLGWHENERQAHVFLAMLDAATPDSAGPEASAPAPVPPPPPAAEPPAEPEAPAERTSPDVEGDQ